MQFQDLVLTVAERDNLAQKLLTAVVLAKGTQITEAITLLNEVIGYLERWVGRSPDGLHEPIRVSNQDATATTRALNNALQSVTAYWTILEEVAKHMREDWQPPIRLRLGLTRHGLEIHGNRRSGHVLYGHYESNEFRAYHDHTAVLTQENSAQAPAVVQAMLENYIPLGLLDYPTAVALKTLYGVHLALAE